MTLTSAINLDAAGSLTGIYVANSTNVTLDGFTLDNANYGIYAQSGNTNLTFKNLNLSGAGFGIGMRVDGSGHKLENVTANRRGTGVFLQSTTNPSINGVIANECVTGLSMSSTFFSVAPTATTLTGLNLTNSSTGLDLSTVGVSLPCTVATCPLAIGTANVVSLAGSPTAISVTSAPAVSVAAAALGLTTSGSTTVKHSNTLPAVVAPCGTTITSNLVLTANLDCTGVTGTAITIGAANLTIDGGGLYKIIAPNAATVIDTNSFNATTITGLDVSGARVAGTGILLKNGSGHNLTNVTANNRTFGVKATNNASLTIAGLKAKWCSSGLYLNGQTSAPTLSGLRLTNGDTGLGVDGFDGWFGATSGPKFTFTAAMFSDLSGNDTSIAFYENSGNGVKNVVVDGLKADGVTLLALDGRINGLLASGTTGLVLKNLNVSGLRPAAQSTYGISLTGVNATGRRSIANSLENITADLRTFGVNAAVASDLTIDKLSADRCGTGLQIDGSIYTGGFVRPLNLTNLTLTGSGTALSMTSVDGADLTFPTDATKNLVIGPAMFTTPPVPPVTPAPKTGFMGSRNAVYLGGNDKNLIVSGTSLADKWKLDTTYSGVYARALSNGALTFRYLDVSGPGYWQGDNLGSFYTGVSVVGTGHTIEDVVANTRWSGVFIGGTGHKLRRISASGNVYGIQLGDGGTAGFAFSFASAELKDLELSGNSWGLYVRTPATPTPPFVFDSSVLKTSSGNGSDIVFENANKLTVQNLTLPGYYSGMRLEGTNSDIVLSNLETSATKYPHNYGAIIKGTNIQVLDVVANDRYRGVSNEDYAVPKLTVKRLKAARAAWAALYLGGTTTAVTSANPLVLEDLELTDNASAYGLALSFDASAAPLTLNGSTFKKLGGSWTDIYFKGSAKKFTVDGAAASVVGGGTRGLPLTGWGAGVYADGGASTSGLTFKNLDVSNTWPSGNGIYAQGVDHVVSNVVANHRTNGFYFNSTNHVSVDDARCDGCSKGVWLESTVAPPAAVPVLTNLKISNTAYGLQANTLTGPLTIGATALPTGAFANNCYDLYLAASVTKVTVSGLSLNGYCGGVSAWAVGNSEDTFEHLNLSAAAPNGSGIELYGGANHVINDVTIKGRNTGINVSTTSRPTISGVRIDGAGADGVTLSSITGAAPVLSDIKATNSYRTFYGTTVAGPLTLDASVFPTGAFDGNASGIWLQAMSNVTVSGLTMRKTYDTAIQTYINGSSGANNSNMTFQNLDLTRTCGGGQGLYLAGSNLVVDGVTASGWQTGISHEGGGDGVTIKNSVVGANTRGIAIGGTTFIANTTVANDLANTAMTFKVASTLNISAGKTLIIGTGVGAQTVVVASVNTTTLFVTLNALGLSGTPARRHHRARRGLRHALRARQERHLRQRPGARRRRRRCRVRHGGRGDQQQLLALGHGSQARDPEPVGLVATS